MDRERLGNRVFTQDRLTDKNIDFRIVKPILVEKVKQTRLVFEKLVNKS